MKIIDGGEGSVPIKSWCENLEEGAVEQAKNLARLPFAFRQVCIMPDGHLGYGMPIGGVLATKGVVICNAVGVDIGCGMRAAQSSLTEIDTATLKKIVGRIRQVIPVGFNKYAKPLPMAESAMPDNDGDFAINDPLYGNALLQLGTLGGGNHFIEIQKGSDGHIWVMIHSGSRNLGKQVADFHNKTAVVLNEKWYSQVPKEWELAFLPLNTEHGDAYMKQMDFCVKYAEANRGIMMAIIEQVFTEEMGATNGFANCTFQGSLDVAHNYAKMENHCETCIDIQDSDSRMLGLLLGDPRITKVRDFLAGYHPVFHSCGGLLLTGATSDLRPSPSQFDALEQMSHALHSLLPELGERRTRLGPSCLCEGVTSARIDASSSSALSTFGPDFCRLFGVEKENRRLGRVLVNIFFGALAYNQEHNRHKHLHKTKDVVIHRKGATAAYEGQMGIIPGSQGTASYIVKGLGNRESFMSCSHGAGRKMGRKEAQRTLNLEEEKKRLDDQGILHAVRGVDDLDEAAGAYKDVRVVMEEQKDLVSIVTELKPLAVVKG